MLAETKERVQKEWEYNKNKLENFAAEKEMKIRQLKFTFCTFNEIDCKWLEYQKYLQKKREVSFLIQFHGVSVLL